MAGWIDEVLSGYDGAVILEDRIRRACTEGKPDWEVRILVDRLMELMSYPEDYVHSYLRRYVRSYGPYEKAMREMA
jgi:hypothetical protein